MKIVAVAFVVLLSGCVDLSGEPEFDFASPRIGDRVTYSGSDGSTLTVELTGLAERRDGLLRPHQAAVIDWAYSPRGDDGASFRFEEVVALRTGLIVNQIAFCGNLRGAGSGLSGPFVCHDDRAVVIGSAGGLPGGFGSGPTWIPGRSVESGFSIAPLDRLVESVTLHYNVGSRSRDDMDRHCRSFDVGARVVRTLPWSGSGRPFTLCPHDPWPVEFEATPTRILALLTGSSYDAAEPIVYARSSFAAGATPISWGSGNDAFQSASQGLEPEPRHAPFYVQGLGQGLAFPVAEAHDVATREVPAYAALMGNGGILEQFEHTLDSRVESPNDLYGERNSDVILVASLAHDSLRVKLHKSLTYVAGIPSTTYDVVTSNEGHQDEPSPSSATVDPVLASNWSSDLAGGLSNQFQAMGFSHERRLNATTIWTMSVPLPRDLAGYEVYVSFDDPNFTATTGVFYPYYARIDGPTGAILHLTVKPTSLPF
ncbi:MAG: hypothetical protein WC876_01465 [Candidatus Thermoplasmatota archaeon]|jgi:hypothetical protein